jgi:hypothetical protein
MTLEDHAKKIADFVVSANFKFFIVPLVTAALSVFLKKASKNDRFAIPRKEDFAVGLELALAAMIGFVAYSVSVAQRLINAGTPLPQEFLPLQSRFMSSHWLILVFGFGLWAISHMVRKFGWKNETEMKWFFGIIIPFFYGLFTLIIVITWIGT